MNNINVQSTITLTPGQLRECLTQYLQQNGISVQAIESVSPNTDHRGEIGSLVMKVQLGGMPSKTPTYRQGL